MTTRCWQGLTEQPEGDLAAHVRAWGQWVLEKSEGGPRTLLSGDRRQADHSLPLGAHGQMQRLPRHDPIAEDAVVMQERKTGVLF